MRCKCCGSELLDDAIICSYCAKVVQYKTHFSPTESEPLVLEIHSATRCRTLQPETIKAGVILIVLILLVLVSNLGFNRQQKNRIIHTKWSDKIAVSNVYIDRFTADDHVTVTGKLSNISDRNMQRVIIRAYAIDVVAQQIGEEYFSIEPKILLPGQDVEFQILIKCKTSIVHRVKLEIYNAEVQPEIIRPIKWSGVGGKG